MAEKKKRKAEGGSPSGGSGRRVAPGGAGARPRASRDRAAASQSPGFDFVNPYNFVRLGKVGQKSGHVSLASFKGLSGRLTCKLTTHTPLFTPDPLSIEVDGGEAPRRMRFFRIGEKPAIPATSIKGMVRSVIEAVTGSCLSQFDETALDYRSTRGGFKAGKVISLPGGGNPGIIEEMSCAWVNMPGVNDPVRTPGGNIPIARLSNAHMNGQTVYVKVKTISQYMTSRGRMINLPFHIVTGISDSPQTGYIKGYLRITGKTVPNKKRERVFFELDNPRRFEFGKEEVEEYEDILGKQLENARSRGLDLGVSSNKLSVGDLVYFEVDPVGTGRVRRIFRVEMPRMRYQRSRGDLLPPRYHPCRDIGELCPACRLFGTVAKEAEEEAERKALAGRVSFSDAFLASESKEPRFEKKFLRVLSSPKPTSCNFYLVDPANHAKVRNYDGVAVTGPRGQLDGGDVGRVSLRGRKFYWHQKYDGTLERYTASEEQLREAGQLQMTSEVELLLPEATFEFTVDFVNLEEEELGLLLWGLELEKGIGEKPMRHKLGMGKPLGLGSVSIEVMAIEVWGENRFLSFEHPAGEGKEKERKGELVNKFKKTLAEEAGVSDFNDLEQVKDLKAIMSFIPDDVQYPPGGYDWFMRNKNVSLPTVQDIVSRSARGSSRP